MKSINRTKIVATIGPATLDLNIFKKLVAEGINYIRINSAYGNYEQYDGILANLRKVDKKGKIKVIFDLKKARDIPYFLKNDLDILALSFANNPQQIKLMRKRLPKTFLVSKIETREGVENFQQILKLSDGIMVARGDLGRAVRLERVPPLQKEFIYETKRAGKFSITATEMLLSMALSPKPTRAEVSDVANAVFDGTSAVMLSEETAIGKYPVEAVRYMRKIIFEAERWHSSLIREERESGK